MADMQTCSHLVQPNLKMFALKIVQANKGSNKPKQSSSNCIDVIDGKLVAAEESGTISLFFCIMLDVPGLVPKDSNCFCIK